MRRKSSLEKNRAKTLKWYPGAIVAQDLDGDFYIEHQETNIFEEFLLTNASSPAEAWEKGALCAKTTQNFNRTHPLRDMDLSTNDAETQEVKKRRGRPRKNKGSILSRTVRI